MRRRLMTAGVSFLLVLGLAGPVAANPKEMGAVVFQGTASVGKTKTDANGIANDGCDSVSGGGLGLPIVSQAKNAFYRLASSDLIFTNGIGAVVSLNICGSLGPVWDNLIKVPGNTKKGIGAACGVSKAYDGKGVVRFITGGSGIGSKAANEALWVTDVGWKLAPGGILPVTGKAHTGGDANGKGKAPVSGFAGLVIANGGQACADKRDNPKLPVLSTSRAKDAPDNRGAVSFDVIGIVVLVPDGAFLANRNDRPGSPKGSNDMPFFCKKQKEGPEPCAYKKKK